MTTNTEKLTRLINEKIENMPFEGQPLELYEPIRYIMRLGGKRMRPLLTLLAYSMYKKDIDSAVNQAVGVEVFHNFTLMHDDIMDRAPLRRGKPTVHEKWSDNVAILSGDVMLVKAYELMMETPDDKLRHTLQLFNDCATAVCEGQQHDMNFETTSGVTEAAYLDMIRQKTAVLLGFSLELGALLGGASEKNQVLLREFGVSVGIGFQLKDDLLDVYADKEKFGKQVGGDIVANKKTFLLIKAIEKAKGSTAKSLTKWLEKKKFDKKEKVAAVTEIYNQLGIKALTEAKMNEYFDKGFKALKKLEAPLAQKATLRAFTEWLIDREK